MREVMPYVQKINAVYPELAKLSNDELRAKTDEIKKQIADYVQPQKDEIARLKASIEETPIEKREAIYRRVDDLEKEIKKRFEEVLDEVLPTVSFFDSVTTPYGYPYIIVCIYAHSVRHTVFYRE